MFFVKEKKLQNAWIFFQYEQLLVFFLLCKPIETIEQTIFSTSLEFQQEIGTVVLTSHLFC